LSEEQVARVYGEALFDAAKAADVIHEVGRELREFVEALAASRALAAVMADPQIEKSSKQRVLSELTRDAQPLLRNTLHLLLDRGRFDVVRLMEAEYAALAAVEAKLIEVEVTSAVDLSDKAREKIAAKVGEATGFRVRVEPKVDPAIIGGLVLRFGDMIVDGSVRSRIRQLRRRLVTAELRGDVE
jgi:F-type H+-transporting ATPase subunit delta